MLNERRQLDELKLAITEERERRDCEARSLHADMMALQNDYERIRWVFTWSGLFEFFSANNKYKLQERKLVAGA